MSAGSDERRHTGRRRNEQARQAVLDAALELAADAGASGFTMEELARRAAVSKRTLYRWWASRSAVLAEALAEYAAAVVVTAGTGDPVADLHAFIRTTYRGASTAEVAPALKLLMADAQYDEDAARALRAFIDRRRDALLDLLSTAREQGALPANADSATTADIVFGLVWYRLLVGHVVADDEAADAVARLILEQR